MPQSIQERDKELEKIVKENKMSFVPFTSRRLGFEKEGVYVCLEHRNLGEIAVDTHTGDIIQNIQNTGTAIDHVLDHIRTYLQIERNAYVGASPLYKEAHNGDRALYVLYEADDNN